MFSEGEESPEALRKRLGTIPAVGWNLQSGQLASSPSSTLYPQADHSLSGRVVTDC